jgi:magnesium chelatase subunit D
MSEARTSAPDMSLVWADAVLAAALFAVDPRGLGLVVRSRAGAVRDRWLGILRHMLPPDAPFRRVPLGISDDRLIGGLDLSASIAEGRAIVSSGVLAEADGGVVIIAMAESVDRSTAARIAAAHDDGEVAIEREGFSRRSPSRFGIVALDEGAEPDERLPHVLADRLALYVDLDGVSIREAGSPNPVSPEDVVAARGSYAAVEVGDGVCAALCATAMALGVASLRAPLLAVRAAAAHAALHGRVVADEDDAVVAARIVLAPRATVLPAADEEPSPPPPEDQEPQQESEPDGERDSSTVEPLEDMILAAARAAIPKGLLARLMVERAGLTRAKESGRSGATKKSVLRGRPAGVRQGRPHAGARLHLIETLRAAAPWQRLRRADQCDERAPRPAVRFRPEDFRIRRHVERAQTTTIFVVDASGSAALNRLAEAKGAVELMLADCYVRRDQVALISFRNKTADLLLPPTRSLARAKRCLAAMPAGGGTPLATGLNAAAQLAASITARGGVVALVLMTDGRANIALDGAPGRARAGEEALAAARMIRAQRLPCALIDTSPQPQQQQQQLAKSLNATYLPLPHADAAQLTGAMRGTIDRAPPARSRSS